MGCHSQQSQNRAVPSKNDPPAGNRIGLLEKLVAAARRVGVDDPRVLDAMRRVPRAAFVPQDQVTAFERSAEGLVSPEVVCHARFVRLYGRHGYK